MVTGDAAYIKKINRSLIVRKIIEHDGISRASLSKVTGLNKATISVQVADLLDDELIIESRHEHNSLGRRPIMLSINRNAGYALGIDLDHKQIIFTLSDLLGYPIHTEKLQLDTTDYDRILNILIKEINNFKERCQISRYGIIGVVIGIHGTITNDEIINFVPKLQWRNQNLKVDLEQASNLSVSIENNANLTTFAESVYKFNHSEHLLSITMQTGIGLGLMIKGELLKGYHGYAGEMGHMIVVPDGASCSCGNLGCWEMYASEASFFRQLAAIKGKPSISYSEVALLLEKADPSTYEQMQNFIKYVTIGLNNVINLYNPEIIVLNSPLLQLYPDAIVEIKNRLNSTISDYSELVFSELGDQACVMGACAFAIKKFLKIPNLSLQITDKNMAELGEYFFA